MRTAMRLATSPLGTYPGGSPPSVPRVLHHRATIGCMVKCQAAGCIAEATETLEHDNYDHTGREVSHVCREHQRASVQRDTAPLMLKFLTARQELQEAAEAVGDLDLLQDPAVLRQRLTSPEMDRYVALLDDQITTWRRVNEIVNILPDPALKATAAQSDEEVSWREDLLRDLLARRQRFA